MANDILSCPRSEVTVDCKGIIGPLEAWRQSVGHGGINWKPLSPRVVEGVGKLKPQLTRVFLQEFFDVNPACGKLNWARLDPFLDSFARTGATVVAAIAIKPPPLYPKIDHALWRPNDVKAWQHVIREMVRRYSVERSIVSHWEVGNETDIGESGGCPYLITEPEDYAEYYSMTIRPILEACPQAQVGGPAIASIRNKPIAGFVDYCRRTGTRLDFISWHVYNSNPAAHVECIRIGRSLIDGYPGRRPEMMVTEWNRDLGGSVHVEDQAFEPKRAASTAATVMDMLDAGLDWSFYYHIWDQTCFHEDFASIFSPAGLAGMVRHWNEIPRRLGLFGVGGDVRPQYFVYAMLSRLGEERLAVECPATDPQVGLRVLAGRSRGCVSVMAVNYNGEEGGARVAVLRFRGLRPGVKRLTVRRVDDDRRWCPETLELLPLERRDVSTTADFECQVLLPADTVAEVCLEELTR